MNIKDTIAAINQMETEKVIERYAIGGVIDAVRFQGIISRHGLQEAWKRFETQFLTDPQ